jgi:hypothetical protein
MASDKYKPRKWKQKFKDEPIVPLYDEETKCDRCGKEGAADFGTEILCRNCVSDDVFNDYAIE